MECSVVHHKPTGGGIRIVGFPGPEDMSPTKSSSRSSIWSRLKRLGEHESKTVPMIEKYPKLRGVQRFKGLKMLFEDSHVEHAVGKELVAAGIVSVLGGHDAGNGGFDESGFHGGGVQTIRIQHG